MLLDEIPLLISQLASRGGRGPVVRWQLTGGWQVRIDRESGTATAWRHGVLVGRILPVVELIEGVDGDELALALAGAIRERADVNPCDWKARQVAGAPLAGAGGLVTGRDLLNRMRAASGGAAA